MPQQLARRLLQQARAGGVHQSQAIVRVEGEQRDIDLFDHSAQQLRRFDRMGALVGKRICKRVDLLRQLSQRIVGAAPRARNE